MCDNQINQSLNHKITYIGPPPQPVYFAWINITNSIIPELWKIHSCSLKSRETEDCSKNGIKNNWRGNRIFEIHLKNWSLKGYLKIGVFEFIWISNFYKLNVRMRILEIKFERDWKFENDLRVRDFKWVDKWMSE